MSNTKQTIQDDLSDLLTCLSKDVVDIQQKLEHHHHQDLQRFQARFPEVPTSLQPCLALLAPARQRIASHEVTVRLHWQEKVEKGVSAGISAGLLNFSADVRYQRNTQSDSRLTLTVVQAAVSEKDFLNE